MRCCEIANKRLAANILQILTVTDFEIRLTTNRVAAVSLVSPFLEHGVLAEAQVVSQEGALWDSLILTQIARSRYSQAYSLGGNSDAASGYQSVL